MKAPNTWPKGLLSACLIIVSWPHLSDLTPRHKEVRPRTCSEILSAKAPPIIADQDIVKGSWGNG